MSEEVINGFFNRIFGFLLSNNYISQINEERIQDLKNGLEKEIRNCFNEVRDITYPQDNQGDITTSEEDDDEETDPGMLIGKDYGFNAYMQYLEYGKREISIGDLKVGTVLNTNRNLEGCILLKDSDKLQLFRHFKRFPGDINKYIEKIPGGLDLLCIEIVQDKEWRVELEDNTWDYEKLILCVDRKGNYRAFVYYTDLSTNDCSQACGKARLT